MKNSLEFGEIFQDVNINQVHLEYLSAGSAIDLSRPLEGSIC